jgi:SAM-dependent methyltransferase
MRGDRQEWRYLPYRLGMKILRVDLSWVSAKDSGLSEERSHWHSNSGGPDLERLLDTLPISRSDAVLDVGCGKGGAMLTLARYPFARVDGVEISPKLAQIARANLERLGILNAAVFCSDATDFTNLDLYTYLYMYNPFPAQVMLLVLENITSSLKRRKRCATLIYKNPLCNALVLEAGFSKVREFEQTHVHYPPFYVYRADGSQWTEPIENHQNG